MNVSNPYVVANHPGKLTPGSGGESSGPSKVEVAGISFSTSNKNTAGGTVNTQNDSANSSIHGNVRFTRENGDEPGITFVNLNDYLTTDTNYSFYVRARSTNEFIFAWDFRSNANNVSTTIYQTDFAQFTSLTTAYSGGTTAISLTDDEMDQGASGGTYDYYLIDSNYTFTNSTDYLFCAGEEFSSGNLYLDSVVFIPN